MKAEICPTITALDFRDYKVQMKKVLPFSRRIHIDLMDGVFAAPVNLSIDQLYWPANIAVDIHFMYKQPLSHIDALIALAPRLVLVHAEAEGIFEPFATRLHQHGIEVGVVLMPQTPVETIRSSLGLIDHVLIFSGRLGHNGGIADLRLLVKAHQLRRLKPAVEIGWDGGVSASNIRELIAGGVDVLNVGGYIQHAIDPVKAYATLNAML